MPKNTLIPTDGQEDYILEDFRNIKEYFYTKTGYIPQAICSSLDALIMLLHQYKIELRSTRRKP